MKANNLGVKTDPQQHSQEKDLKIMTWVTPFQVPS